MIIYLSLLISMIGLVVFLASRNPANGDIKTVGLHMFWVGMLAFLLTGVPHLLAVLK